MASHPGPTHHGTGHSHGPVCVGQIVPEFVAHLQRRESRLGGALNVSEAVREMKVKSIDKFTFLDDSATVKVYIELDGPLQNVSSNDVEAEFSERSLLVTLTTPDCIFKFHVDRLTHSVDPLRCKATVTKSRKLLLKLFKQNHMSNWTRLRAAA